MYCVIELFTVLSVPLNPQGDHKIAEPVIMHHQILYRRNFWICLDHPQNIVCYALVGVLTHDPPQDFPKAPHDLQKYSSAGAIRFPPSK